MRPLFTQARVAASAERFLDGLLGEERRKTGWMREEAAGDPGPWRQQAILGRAPWDADALRDIVRDYALDTLADPEAVLVIDETGFLKQGHASCGVARQYTGSAARSPIARLASSPAMSRAMDMPLSIGRFICQKPGLMIWSGEPGPMSPRPCNSPQNLLLPAP